MPPSSPCAVQAGVSSPPSIPLFLFLPPPRSQKLECPDCVRTLTFAWQEVDDVPGCSSDDEQWGSLSLLGSDQLPASSGGRSGPAGGAGGSNRLQQMWIVCEVRVFSLPLCPSDAHPSVPSPTLHLVTPLAPPALLPAVLQPRHTGRCH